MKKEIKIVAAILAALVFFISGVTVGTINSINVNVNMPEGEAAPVVQQAPATTQAPATAAPTTAAPTTQAPTTAAPQGGNTTTTAAPKGDTTTTAAPKGDTTTTAAPQGNNGAKVPSTTDEVCAAYNKAINDYRAYKGTVTLHKVENTQVNITELPSIAKMLESTINKVISNVVKPVDETFTFSDGKDVNDPARYIEHKMIPVNRDATVKAADVTSATAVANADGGYTITLQFVSETSTFDGTNTTNPDHHMTAMDPLNLATLSLDPIKINNAEMYYSGATTKLTVDSQGRLIKLENKLPLEGKGTGGALGIEATIGLAGQMDSVYTIQYQ